MGSSYAIADTQQSAETTVDSALNNNTTVNQNPVETVGSNQTQSMVQNTTNITQSTSSNSQNSVNTGTNTQNSVQNVDVTNQNSVNNTTNTQKPQALQNQGFSNPQIENWQAAAGTTKNISTNQTVALPSFTTGDIQSAAAKVKAYIESNHQLPGYVTIGTTQISMPAFLKLMVTGLLQINSKITTSIAFKDVNNPQNSTGSFTKGNINKSSYLDIAQRIKSFISSNGVAPNYATTGLGKVQFEQLVYMFSKVLNYYNTNKALPNYVSMDPGVRISPAQMFTIDQIKSAAASVKSYVETNHGLPNYVTIGSVQVKMTDFLRLLIIGTINVNNNSNAQISLQTVNTAAMPAETITSGNLTKANYIDLANRVKAFIDANGALPNYATTNLGKMGYESLIYLYSKILAYDSTNKALPNYVSVSSWSTVSTVPVPADLQKYLKETKNCQVTNSQIQALAKSITSGKSSTYDKAVAIFNWVRDNIAYSFYYNSAKGAVGTLTSRSANCCDTSNLLVALERAAGIPAEYVHGYCKFSDGWYGHVWTKIWVNGKWYTADAISSSNTFGVINNWNTATVTIYGTYAELPF